MNRTLENCIEKNQCETCQVIFSGVWKFSYDWITAHSKTLSLKWLSTTYSELLWSRFSVSLPQRNPSALSHILCSKTECSPGNVMNNQQYKCWVCGRFQASVFQHVWTMQEFNAGSLSRHFHSRALHGKCQFTLTKQCIRALFRSSPC